MNQQGQSRIKLHHINISHQELYQQLYQNPSVMKYIGTPLNNEQVVKSFELLIERDGLFADQMTMMIHYRAKYVGLIQAKLKENHWSLGIMLLPEYHGKGIAQESHELIIKLIEQSPNFSKHQSLLAKCMSANKAANALYRNLGFKLMDSETEMNTTTNRWERNL